MRQSPKIDRRWGQRRRAREAPSSAYEDRDASTRQRRRLGHLQIHSPRDVISAVAEHGGTSSHGLYVLGELAVVIDYGQPCGPPAAVGCHDDLAHQPRARLLRRTVEDAVHVREEDGPRGV